MDKKYLNDEFDHFFEFPTNDRSQVSSVSAKLFAEHIAYPILMDNAQFQAEIAELKRQLDEALRVTFDPKVLDKMNVMQRQLAESQAREAKLRGGLHVAGMNCVDDFVSAGALQLADLPHDDTALKEYRDAVIEDCIVVCTPDDSYRDNWFAAKVDCVDRLRKLKAP